MQSGILVVAKFDQIKLHAENADDIIPAFVSLPLFKQESAGQCWAAKEVVVALVNYMAVA